jgi:hypothetical protein
MGWLHAPYRLNKEDETRSRIKRLSESHPNAPELKMPELDSHEYVLELFYESGMVLNGANGAVPITWTELRNYSDQSGAVLTPWESKMIINMSRAYCTAYHDGQSPSALPPWVDDSQEALAAMRESVASKFKALSAGALPKTDQAKPRKKPKPA